MIRQAHDQAGTAGDWLPRMGVLGSGLWPSIVGGPVPRDGCEPQGKMAAMSKKKKNQKVVEDSQSRTVCRNRKARHEYEILDQMECGIVLKGSEVKSIRDNKCSINEAFARLENNEVWLHGCDIAEYPQATVMNHEPRRPRKLLMHKREVAKFAQEAAQQGLTLIPLSVYFTRGIVKVKLAVARGRKLYDKRDKLRKTTDRQDMRKALGRRG